MLTDLHTHTSRSDGLLGPGALVAAAHAAGLKALALTDHDSVAGIAEAAAEAARLGMTLVPGVELSFRDVDAASGRTAEHHMLGLFVAPAAPGLLAYLHGLQQERRSMADATLARLRQLGLPVSAARVAELAAGAVVTRPHIARAMVEAGYVATVGEAFERFLGSGRPAAVERPGPGAAATIAAIRGAGGVASLAHPVFGQEADWAERLATLPGLLDRLVQSGLAAVECRYPDATPAIAEQLAAWAGERGLIRTGGSDYHGPDRAPYAELGHSAVGTEVVSQLSAISCQLSAAS